MDTVLKDSTQAKEDQKNETPFIHLFKTPLSYYCYDVNTNQIIGIDKETYEYLANPSDERIEQIENKLEKLKSWGFLSSNRPEKMRHGVSEFLDYQLNENIQQLTLQVTQQCNFNCSYCVYAPKDFEYHRDHSFKRMSEKTAFKALDFFKQHVGNSQNIAVGFYGGEPLLEFELIKKLIPYAEKIFEGKELSFTMTNNGSLLTPDKFEYLSKHNVAINVSLDGPPEIHNRSRKFAATGRGTFGAITKNLALIREKFPEDYEEISFFIVADPRFENSGLYDFFSTNELFSNNRIRYNAVSDALSFEKHYTDENYMIALYTKMFKARLADIDRYDKEVHKIIKEIINGIVSRFDMTMKPRITLPSTISHGGPCIPGQRRLFVTVDGNFLPCERISELSDPNIIGNLEEGFFYDKADKVLNICELTEDNCKDCWAITHCDICVRYCDNNGELSSALKSKKCRESKRNAEYILRDYLSYCDITK